MRAAIALIVAYLLGSVLPADLLARAQGIDIRAVGTRNPGTTNAFDQMGFLPGMVTLLYDGSVGLLSMYVAWRLGLADGWVYAAGLAAVAGHCFPAFARFRGGQGMAAATGMLLWGIWRAVSVGWMTPAGLAGLCTMAIAVYAIGRSATVVGVFAVPTLVIQLLLARPDLGYGVFMTALGALIFAVQVAIARERHLFRVAPPVRARFARSRPRVR